MNLLVEFFRDTLSGIWYFLYLMLCILMIFFVLGIVADRKRQMINQKLKEKKTYDIESGKEAKIAAMESKQVLSARTKEENSQDNEQKQEEPIVLNSSDDVNNTAVNTTPQQVVIEEPAVQQSVVEQPVVQQPIPAQTTTPDANQAVEPLILNSNE